jgi:hypothetical protein
LLTAIVGEGLIAAMRCAMIDMLRGSRPCIQRHGA